MGGMYHIDQVEWRECVKKTDKKAAAKPMRSQGTAEDLDPMVSKVLYPTRNAAAHVTQEKISCFRKGMKKRCFTCSLPGDMDRRL